MLATFKETVKSVSDKTYGRVIVVRPIKSVLWYFSRYVLLFASLPLIFGVVLITYFVPQFSSLVEEHVPEGYLGLNGGLLDTSYYPSQLSFPDAAFRFTPDQTLPDSLESLPVGLYVYQDGLVQAEEGGSYRVQKFTDVSDFHLEKAQLVSWLKGHTVQVWLILFAAGLAVWVVAAALFWSFRVSSLLLWSAGFWVFGRLVKRPLSYLAAFRLAVYAAVPSLIISALLYIAPHPYLSYLNLGIFIFLSLSWAWNLPAQAGLPKKDGHASK